MPRNESPFREIIKSIIREELQAMLSGEDTQEFDLGQDSASEGRSRGGQIGGRTRGANKGRVSKPDDRRLKQNREV